MCRLEGQSVVYSGGQWWREVRPCFFRPILPFLKAPIAPIRPPYRAFLGGFQYVPAAAAAASANSHLDYLVFSDAGRYRLDNLRSSRRSQVRFAENLFRVRPFRTCAEFKASAHSVYLEFHKRTQYRYIASRVVKTHFDRWADAEFVDPGLVALGAWAGQTLVAVSLSRVIGDIWFYSTFFAADDALKQHVADLLLHNVRTLAVNLADVKCVFVGMVAKSGAAESKNRFYLQRGAEVVRRPAVLRINPVAEWMLSRLRPDLWERLCGDVDAASSVRSPVR